MKALIFAAGRGERMRPLTDACPKPLLEVGGRPLIDHHVAALVAAGFTDIVVNLSWLGEKIVEHLADGQAFGAAIRYSREGPSPLASGGGIAHARELLGDEPFAAVNSDTLHDFPLHRLRRPLPANVDAHFVLVDNPPHHPQGDFALEGDYLRNDGQPRLTFSGLAIYRPQLARESGAYSIIPQIRTLCARGRVTAEHHRGRWLDVGTPQRLEQAQTYF